MMGIFRRNPVAKHLGQQEMSGFIDGSLPIEQATMCETHFRTCEACKNEFLAIQETVFLLRQIPMDKPQKSFILTRQEAQDSSWSLNNPLWIRRIGGVMALVAVLLFGGEFTGMGGFYDDSIPQQVGSKTLPSLIRISGESGPEGSLSLVQSQESIDALGYSETFPSGDPQLNDRESIGVTGESTTQFRLWRLELGLFIFGIIFFLLGFFKVRKSYF